MTNKKKVLLAVEGNSIINSAYMDEMILSVVNQSYQNLELVLVNASPQNQELADAVAGCNRPTPLQGLAVFSNRAVLCGEDSRAHIYRSNTRLGRFDGPSTLFANLPTAIVEAVDTK